MELTLRLCCMALVVFHSYVKITTGEIKCPAGAGSEKCWFIVWEIGFAQHCGSYPVVLKQHPN